MEIVYQIGFIMTLILLTFTKTNKVTGIIVGVIFLILICTIQKIKNIFLILLPLMFILFLTLFTYQNNLKIDSKINLETTINKGIGTLKKVDNKIVLGNYLCKFENVPNGDFQINGKISKIQGNFLHIDIIEKKEISQNIFKIHLKNCSDRLLKNCDFQLKNLYNGVILGESNHIYKSLKIKFRYLGLSHLIALSGFHIGIILLIFNSFLKKINIKRNYKIIILMVFLSFYYFGVNISPSLTRAYIMGMIVLISRLSYENSDILKSLGVAYILSLFISPNSLFSLSFQLSYLAIFFIVGIFPKIKRFLKLKNKFLENFLLIITIQIWLMPIVVGKFGMIQFLSFLPNVILVPIGSIFIGLSFIGLVLENIKLGFIILPFIKISYWIFIYGLDLFYKIPYMSINLNIKLGNTIYIFYWCIIFLFFKQKKNKDFSKKNNTHNLIKNR